MTNWKRDKVNGSNRRRAADDAETFAFPPSQTFSTVGKHRSNMTLSHQDGTISASLSCMYWRRRWTISSCIHSNKNGTLLTESWDNLLSCLWHNMLFYVESLVLCDFLLPVFVFFPSIFGEPMCSCS